MTAFQASFGTGVVSVLLVLAVACDGRSVEVLGAGTVERDAGPPSDANSPYPLPTSNYCAAIPSYAGTQIVDGLPDDFDLVPAMAFRVNEAPWKRGVGSFPQEARLLVAWSERGMHMHVHVDDPVLVVSPTPELAAGDSVEFYLAATSDLNGPIDGVRDGGSTQVIVVPPSDGLPARATTFHHPSKGVQTEEPFDPTLFTARVVDGGYEVEILMPWRGTVPSADALVGFDVAINVADRDVATGRQLQAAIGYRLPVGESNCTADVGPQPFCDNRTWCTPRLE